MRRARGEREENRLSPSDRNTIARLPWFFFTTFLLGAKALRTPFPPIRCQGALYPNISSRLARERGKNTRKRLKHASARLVSLLLLLGSDHGEARDKQTCLLPSFRASS